MNKIILLFLFTFSSSSYGRGSELLESNFNWYLDNHLHIQSTLTKGEMREIVPIINTLGTTWQFHDGAIRAEVAPALATAFIYHPKLMLAWFQKHPNEFEQWLKQLPYKLLTDYNGNKKPHLEKVKHDIIESLIKFSGSNKDTDLVKMAKNLTRILQETTVREIN